MQDAWDAHMLIASAVSAGAERALSRVCAWLDHGRASAINALTLPLASSLLRASRSR